MHIHGAGITFSIVQNITEEKTVLTNYLSNITAYMKL